MTPEEQAVIDAAKRFVAGDGYVQDIAEALRALEPPKPELPTEPPIGSIVLDKDDEAWKRGRMGWYLTGANADAGVGGRSWVGLLERFGPVTHVVPAPKVVDADLARRLADRLESCTVSNHGASGHSGPLAACVFNACVQDVAVIAEARAQIGGE